MGSLTRYPTGTPGIGLPPASYTTARSGTGVPPMAVVSAGSITTRAALAPGPTYVAVNGCGAAVCPAVSVTVALRSYHVVPPPNATTLRKKSSVLWRSSTASSMTMASLGGCTAKALSKARLLSGRRSWTRTESTGIGGWPGWSWNSGERSNAAVPRRSGAVG